MRLIGLNAGLRRGKDTTFEIIFDHASAVGKLAIRRAFADPLKVSGIRAFDLGSESHDEDVALADKIKETGRIVLTWLEDDRLVAHVIDGRQLWQHYGTKAHRSEDLGSSFGPFFWLDNLLPKGHQELYDYNNDLVRRPLWWQSFREDWAGFADIAVITDVRFANEAQRIREFGGEIWLIDANERLGPSTDDHDSEQPIPEHLITKTIDNNGTLEELKANVIDALGEL